MITDVNDKEVGKSDEVTFIYESLGDDQLFKSLTFTPNENIRLSDYVTFEVKTDPSVNEVSLILSNNPGTQIPMTKKRDGEFIKENLMMVSTGNIQIDIALTSSPTQKLTKTGVATLHVSNETLIHNVQTYAIDLQKLYMSWEVSGIPTSGFQIKY